MKTEEIIKAVKSVIGDGPMPLHDPFIDQDDVAKVARCAMEEPVGYSYIRRLQDEVSGLCHRRHAIAVTSGTAALHLAVTALTYTSAPVDVLVPDLTFAGVANAVYHAGNAAAFYDVAAERNLPDIDLRIVGDLLGWPQACDADMWREDIEDAAAALGSSAHGRMAGSMGLVSTISFNHNKIVAGSGGGMVLTDDDDLAAEIMHLATTAKKPSLWFYEHNRIGFNYRMSNLSAALAVGQVVRLAETIERKQRLADLYDRALGGRMFAPMENVHWNAWMNAVTVDNVQQRDELLQALEAERISCRALYTPLHLQEQYGPRPLAPYPESMRLFETTVCLPSGKSAVEASEGRR